jgi:hypothetical protein
MWVSIWFIAVSSNMGVVAVYALNDEFKSVQRYVYEAPSPPILIATCGCVSCLTSTNNMHGLPFRECKNGMVTGISYVLTKSVLVLPILFIFAFFALGLQSFVIQDVPGEAFGMTMLLFVCVMFVFESLAECLAVWFDDPILGKSI